MPNIMQCVLNNVYCKICDSLGKNLWNSQLLAENLVKLVKFYLQTIILNEKKNSSNKIIIKLVLNL